MIRPHDDRLIGVVAVVGPRGRPGGRACSASGDGTDGLRRRLRARPADRLPRPPLPGHRPADDPLRARLPAPARAAARPSSPPRSSSPSAAPCSSAARATCSCSSSASSCSCCPATCWPATPSATGYRPRAPSSTSCSARSLGAIFLFGLAFTWGFTGSTRIAEVAAVAAGVTGPGLSAGLAIGLALLTSGVAFKIAAVPFHYWTPDAYQGSPTPVTGYLSVGPEGRRLRAHPAPLRRGARRRSRPTGSDVIVILAALTMTLGNLVALTQNNVKRMLAYSSIAHTGYILVGLAAFAGAPAGSPAAQAGLAGDPLLHRRLHVHEPRRLRRRRRPPAAARRDQPDRDLRRARAPGAAGRRADDALPALADRHPAARPASSPRPTSSSPPSRPAAG